MSKITKKAAIKKETKKKKITFFSAVLLVIGSTIGAGIFLKNGEILGNVSGSIVLALVSWILSIFGVICMGVSLAEVASATTDSNLGIISWVKNFCHKYLYKVSKNFMAYLYLPINFFIMPYYVVIQFQDAFGWQTQWWISALIAFVITAWFFIVSGLSSKIGNIQNKIITYIKFVPLAFCIIAGIVVACMGFNGIPKLFDPSAHNKLAQMFPTLGVLGSIPAIIFSYDGFYSTAGIQTELEEPKKTPVVLVVGLLIVSVINLLIAVSLLFGSSSGKLNNLAWFFDNAHWVIGIMEVLIAIGILGIINGFAIYNPLYYQELIKNCELPFSDKLKSKVASQKHNWVGVIYPGIITFTFFVAFTLVGALAYIDTNGYSTIGLAPFMGGEAVDGYDIIKNGPCNSLYSFCDLMGNWTSIFAFLCIVFAIIGSMRNRIIQKIKVNKVKGFWFCSIASTAVIGAACLFIVISSIINIAIVSGWAKDIGLEIGGELYTRQDWGKDMLGTIMTLVMLIVFVLVSCIPSYIEINKEKTRKSCRNIA